MKHKAVVASLNSGVNTLTGEGLAEVSTITEHEAAQVERANASSEFVKRSKRSRREQREAEEDSDE